MTKTKDNKPIIQTDAHGHNPQPHYKSLTKRLAVQTGWTDKEVQGVLSQGIQIGRREVIDWVNELNKFPKEIGYYAIAYPKMQDKLKEWGIK